MINTSKLKFLNIFLLLLTTTCKCNLQDGFTTRCDELCSEDDEDAQLQNDLKPDCQRGCQYFNIQFLINASNKSKVTDLTTTENQCKSSCVEAYVQKMKKDSCTDGCRRMKDLQNKAPYINGWLVYMGTPDRSMVLLEPNIDLQSKRDNWISLESEYRLQDYEKEINLYSNYFSKIEETNHRFIKAFNNIDISNCFPSAWKWMILILMLLTILWLRYVTLMSVTNTDLTADSDTDLNANHKLDVNGLRIDVENYFDNDQKKLLIDNNNFDVSNETYFYPTPAIPPPKYNDVVEARIEAALIQAGLL